MRLDPSRNRKGFRPHHRGFARTTSDTCRKRMVCWSLSTTDMSTRAWALTSIVCVVFAVATLLLIWAIKHAGSVPEGRAGPPRLVLLEAAVPAGEREVNGSVRVHMIEYVRGAESHEVARFSVYPALIEDTEFRNSGRKEFALVDSMLSPRRGIVLYERCLAMFVGIFDPEDGRPARVCKVTSCGPSSPVVSARLVEDTSGLRIEVVRDAGRGNDVYEVVVGKDGLECRRKPEDD